MTSLALLFSSRRSNGGPPDGDCSPSRSGPRAGLSRVLAEPVAVEEEALVRRVREGDDRALAEIFHRYAPALAAFAQSYVRDAEIAEELVQDVFLWIVRHRTEWSVRETIRAYLFSAVRHYALDYLKHRTVERKWAASADRQDIAVPAEAIHRLVTDERVARLGTAIAQLAESRRTALTLRWMQELSYAEIAAVLGSSTKAVENQLNRTLRQLREMLGERDSSHDSA